MTKPIGYVIKFTHAEELKELPRGEIKRTLKRLLKEAQFPAGNYDLRIQSTQGPESRHDNETKIVVSKGTYVDQLKLTFKLVSGTYFGRLKHPHQAISQDRVEILKRAVQKLPVLAPASEDEAPRSAKAVLQAQVKATSTQTTRLLESETSVLEDVAELEKAMARIRELQGLLALPRGVLHKKRDWIKAEIAELQVKLRAGQVRNQRNQPD